MTAVFGGFVCLAVFCCFCFLFLKSPYFFCQYMHISSITMTSNTVPKSILVCKQHMNISFQGMFIQCTAQPSPASANICSNCLQRVKALQFVFIQNFFHIVPKHWLWEKKKESILALLPILLSSIKIYFVSFITYNFRTNIVTHGKSSPIM